MATRLGASPILSLNFEGISVTNFLQTLLKRFSRPAPTPVSRSAQIASICYKTLQSIRFDVSGQVYQLHNSKGVEGWMVRLLVPHSRVLRPVDALAVRLYLQDAVAKGLGVDPATFQLMLCQSSEAARLPFEASAINAEFLSARLTTYQHATNSAPSSATPSAAPSKATAATMPVVAPASVPPRPGSVVVATPKPSERAPVASASGASPTVAAPRPASAVTNVSSRSTSAPRSGQPTTRPGIPTSGPAGLPSIAPSAQPQRQSAPASPQQDKIDALLASMEDDDFFEVVEASLTDFQVAQDIEALRSQRRSTGGGTP